MQNILTQKEKIELIEDSHRYVYMNAKEPITQPHPKDMLNEFSRIMQKDIDEVYIALGKPQMHIDDKGTESITYPRYMLQAKMEDFSFGEGLYNHIGNVGIVVDSKSNKAKIYSGERAEACLNMLIFNADSIQEHKINSVNATTFDVAVKELEVNHRKMEEFVTKLRHERVYSTKDSWRKRIGELFETMDSSLYPLFTTAMKKMQDTKTMYYDMPLNDYRIYASMTDRIKDIGVNVQLDKSLAVKELFA